MRTTSLQAALVVAGLIAGLLLSTNDVAAQQRRIVMKGGETIELNDVWSIEKCRSRLTDAPTVELLEGPTELKLWVEPAMVVASRLNCTTPVTGGKLMASLGKIERTLETNITYRVRYKTTAGVRYVGQVYPVSFFPGTDEPSGPTGPSRTWKEFLASVAKKAESAPRLKTRTAVRRNQGRTQPSNVRLASLAPPSGSGREAVYAYCRRAVIRKYGWNGHDGKIYLSQRATFGMTDSCVASGGKIP